MFCHQCGTPVEPSAKYCAKCGVALNNDLNAQENLIPSPSSQNTNADTTMQSELAGRGARLGAVLLDCLIFTVCLIPGIVVLSASNSDVGRGFGGALIAIAWLGLMVIQIVWLVKHGQTLGKRALGIRIVKVRDESTPGFVKVVLLRQFVPALIAGIPYAGIVIWLADALLIFREDRRCLHDLIAETKVIKR